MSVDCDGVRDFLDKIAIYRSTTNPAIDPKLLQDDGELEDELRISQGQIGDLEDQLAEMESHMLKTKQGQEELEANLAKTPFELKYFQDPYPAIENMWIPPPPDCLTASGPKDRCGHPLDMGDAPQGAMTRVGTMYKKDQAGLPEGKELLCEMIRVTKIDRTKGGRFAVSKTEEYLSEICALVPKDASGPDPRGENILIKVFKDLRENFPGWYLTYKG
jgi:hypothetical protein